MQWELIKLRSEYNESQNDLANLINKHETTYRNKERGKNEFSSDEMFIIAKHYRKDIEDIFLPSEYTKSELRKIEKE